MAGAKVVLLLEKEVYTFLLKEITTRCRRRRGRAIAVSASLFTNSK